MNVSKRQLLGGVAASLALGGLGRTLIGEPSGAFQDRRFAYLLNLLSQPDSAAVVGARYLQDRPTDADADRLQALIEGRLRQSVRPMASASGAGPDLRRLDHAQLRQAMRAAVSGDFADGRTIEVDGWILAETEVRLCALTALQYA